MVVLLGETDAPEALQRTLARPPRIAPGDRLGDLAEALRRVEREITGELRGRGRRRAVGEAPRQDVAHRLEGSDGYAELLAHLRVLDREVHGGFCRADEVERERDPAGIDAAGPGVERGGFVEQRLRARGRNHRVQADRREPRRQPLVHLQERHRLDI